MAGLRSKQRPLESVAVDEQAIMGMPAGSILEREATSALVPWVASSVPSAPGKRIRVLVLESTLIFGGVENLLFNIFTRLEPSLFDVTLCTLYEYGPMGRRFVEAGCRVDHSLIRKKYDP